MRIFKIVAVIVILFIGVLLSLIFFNRSIIVPSISENNANLRATEPAISVPLIPTHEIQMPGTPDRGPAQYEATITLTSGTVSENDANLSESEATISVPSSPTHRVQTPGSIDRGRVQIANGTVVADNGFPLRGELLRVSRMDDNGDGIPETDRLNDHSVWRSFVEDHHLNVVRLLLYRPPQQWDQNDPDGCSTPPDRCFDNVNDILPYLDSAVEIASSLGMYVIIDYHPVGGYYVDDAVTWWTAIAPRYKDRSHVIYEISNEPVMWSAAEYDSEDIQYQEDMFLLVRSLAPNSHIILWSFSHASGDGDDMLTKVQVASDIRYDNASVAYHPYGNRNPNELSALRSAGYPILNTEISGDSYDEYASLTATEEAFGASWVWLDGTGFEKNWTEPLPVTWPKDPATGGEPITYDYFICLPSVTG